MFAGMSEEGADLFPGKRHAHCVREVRADTKVALTYQGLTGLAEVALTGGAPDAALVVADSGGPPTLYAQAVAGADVTQAARDVLSRIDGLVAENETALRSSLHNIETVTSTLAQNSQRLDKVMAGLENLTGGGASREIAQAARRDPQACGKSRQAHGRDLRRVTAVRIPAPQEFEAFAIDGRRTLTELKKAIKNIDQHPTPYWR